MQGDSRDSDDRPMAPEKNVRDIITHEYDQDLVNLLPPIDTIDQLINYYFEYCTWLYRYVNQPAFTNAWTLAGIACGHNFQYYYSCFRYSTTHHL